MNNSIQNKRTIAVVGLGYVGLPVAVAFGKKYDVIGFDIRAERISELNDGIDSTGEVSAEDLTSANVRYTSDASDLKSAGFIIVAVPTPIDGSKKPDLSALKNATGIVGQNLSRGAIIVYESTVYPGVTEDVCLPILERESGMKNGVDFKIGYSPERINPGDREHTFTGIMKIVSGQDEEVLNVIDEVYSSVITAGTYRAPSIRVAEAAKVIENSQRDINIAFMNELALIFDRLGISTHEVLKAARTKWNFLPFEPGLVGGHCIGVDPYYLTHKAEEMGYHPQVILSGRRINDGMGKYVAERTVKSMIKAGKTINGADVLVLGFTFKENVPDARNTRVVNIIKELADYGVNVHIYDPLVDPDEIRNACGIEGLASPDFSAPYDAVILAVRHRAFDELTPMVIKPWMKDSAIMVDVKSVFDADDVRGAGFIYRSL